MPQSPRPQLTVLESPVGDGSAEDRLRWIKATPEWTRSSYREDFGKLIRSDAYNVVSNRVSGGWRAIASALEIPLTSAGERQVRRRLKDWREAELISASSGATLHYESDTRRRFLPGEYVVMPGVVSLTSATVVLAMRGVASRDLVRIEQRLGIVVKRINRERVLTALGEDRRRVLVL